MTELTLHYAPRTRAFTALWLLEELGVEYALASFDINTGRHKHADFLALNPMGKIPVVVADGVPVSEMGAIAIYLADRFPSANLAPALDDPHRPAYLRWILFASGVMEPAFGEKFFGWEVPARSVAWGSFADMQRTLAAAVGAGEWLLGERFSAADVCVGATARFGIMFGAFEKTGPIADYVARLSARPAFERAAAIEARESERFGMPS
jgi:glutathione S-transferase